MVDWKKYYIGSCGPFFYDADEDIDDQDGDFSGLKQAGITTEGKASVGAGPALDDDVVRLEDVVDGVVVTDHNNMNSIQGGTSSEYYHLTSAQHGALTTQLAAVSDTTTQDLTGTDSIDQTKLESDLDNIIAAINLIIDRLQTMGILP